MESKYDSDINSLRALEDCIRATKKYTEGVMTMRHEHPLIQGEDFPSKVFCKYYEVYPDVDTSNMSAGTIVEWLSGYKKHIDVVFRYDYRYDKAAISIHDGVDAVKQLAQEIPNFSDALAKVISGNGQKI